MKIKTIDYTRHVIGDNVALSFDDFYEDLKELRLRCPNHTQDSDYPRYNAEYLENSCESDKLQFEMSQRLVLEPEMENRLYPRLLPQSPAGTVSDITSDSTIVTALKPIIKETYNKDISSAESQCISSTFWDYEHHVTAWNAYHDDVFSAYWDECFEKGEECLAASTIADPAAWEEAKTWVKDMKECLPRSYDNASSLADTYSNRPIFLDQLSKDKFFNEYLPTSKRLKLQNHPNRPQWLPENSFVCIVFLDFNTDPKFKEIPELEFWKHKAMASGADGLSKLTGKNLTDTDILSQLFYYESWHYSGIGDTINHLKRLQLSNSVWDEHHTLPEYDLIQSIPAKINGCLLFPGEYFHKIKFPKAYLDTPMRTQVIVLT